VQLPSWTEKISPVASDLALVAELVAAAQQTSAPSTFDVHVLRQQNPERLGGPMIRRPVDGTRTSPAELGGATGEWINVPGGSDQVTILYFHGGAYVRGTLLQGRGIASALAAEVGGRAFAVAYRQAPENPCPAPIEDAVAAYKGLLLSGIEPSSIVMAGDSAGGAIPVAAMVALRDAGIPLPSAGVSISPWADLSLSGESWRINRKNDVIDYGFSAQMAAHYLAGSDPRGPIASPINADLQGLSPLLIIVGAHEALYSDAAALAAAARRRGVQVIHQTYIGMIHVFPMFILRTGDLAIENAARFIMAQRASRIAG
jgi:acetyl esterase/lipase